MKKRKWFNTLEEKKEYDAKCRLEMEKALENVDKAQVKVLDSKPPPKDRCNVKSRNYLNNGPRPHWDESWLFGRKSLKKESL